MRVTTIKMVTPDLLYLNTVVHECSFGEFMQDLKEEVKIYLTGHEKASYVDVFWHLDEYCNQKYGLCHWQKVDMRFLMHKEPNQLVMRTTHEAGE